jgi:hypothetical protein
MGAHRLGRTRSEIETNMRKEWGTSGLTDEQIDKCKHLEKKAEIKEGFIRDSKLIDRA